MLECYLTLYTYLELRMEGAQGISDVITQFKVQTNELSPLRKWSTKIEDLFSILIYK